MAKTDTYEGLLCHCPTAGPVTEGHPLGTPGCESKVPTRHLGWTTLTALPPDWSPEEMYRELAKHALTPEKREQFLRSAEIAKAADLEFAAQKRMAFAVNTEHSAKEALRSATVGSKARAKAEEALERASVRMVSARQAALELRAKSVFG